MSFDTDLILSVGSLLLTIVVALVLRIGFRRGRDVGDV